MAFSPDGRRIVSGGVSRVDETTKQADLKMWDAASGREVLDLVGHSDAVLSVAFSPDGRRIASGSGDKTLRIWDVETGRELVAVEPTFSRAGGKPSVWNLAFSADGRRIAGAVAWDVVVFDAENGKELTRHDRLPASPLGLTFSPDGLQILRSDHIDQPDEAGILRQVPKLTVWDAENDRELSTLEDAQDHFGAGAAFSPDGRRAVTAGPEAISSTRTLRVWDIATGRQVCSIETERVGSFGHVLAFSPDGRRIVSGVMGKLGYSRGERTPTSCR